MDDAHPVVDRRTDGATSALREQGATPPVLFLISLATTVVVAFLGFGPALTVPGGWLIGGGLMIAGVVLTVVAASQFDRQKIPIRPGGRSGSLATAGVFRISRNPMYLGMVLALGGAAVALGSGAGLVIPAVFVILVNRMFIRHEEALLQAEFGQDYSEYSDRVRRWI